MFSELSFLGKCRLWNANISTCTKSFSELEACLKKNQHPNLKARWKHNTRIISHILNTGQSLFMYTHIRSACHEEHCPGDISRYAASEDFSSSKFGICCIKLPCLGNTESTLAWALGLQGRVRNINRVPSLWHSREFILWKQADLWGLMPFSHPRDLEGSNPGSWFLIPGFDPQLQPHSHGQQGRHQGDLSSCLLWQNKYWNWNYT